MTPARARQIDAAEFAAECAAVRARAMTVVAERQQQRRQRMLEVLHGKPAVAVQFNPTLKRAGPPAALLTHNGQTLSTIQWAKIAGIPTHALRRRLHAGWSLERALTEPLQARTRHADAASEGPTPGVDQNFPTLAGTGAPRPVQDLPKLEISE